MELPQLYQYLPVLMLILVAVGITGAMLLLSVVLGQRGRRSRVKDSAYECGMILVGEGRVRFAVKFYLVAMLFILFDIEVIFLYPWASVYRSMLADPATRHLILGSMVTFVGVLLVGYVYVLRKRALDWKE